MKTWVYIADVTVWLVSIAVVQLQVPLL